MANQKRFIKGLFKDTGHIDQPEGTYRHAKNMILNEKDGSVGNEGGTTLSGFIKGHAEDAGITTGAQDFKVIGAIEVNDDKTVLFSTDVVTTFLQHGEHPRSEIGIWENGIYTPIFNPLLGTAINPSVFITNDLNFKQTNPIEGTFKIDSKGDLIVYWTDDLNPPRAFNVDRQIRDNFGGTDGLYGIAPQDIDHIDILNLFPYSGPVPHIGIDDQGTHQNCIIEGGGLRTAVYYLALAYVDEDFVATNYLTVSNPISIVDEFDFTSPTNKKDGAKEGNQTTKAIKWEISNLNTNYKFLRPVVIRSMGKAQEAFKLNDVTFNSTSTSITYSGLETVSTGTPSEVIIDTVAYDTAKTIQQLDNVLYIGNTTGSKDVGYQKYANNIKLRSRIRKIEDFDEFYASVDNIQTGWGTREVNDFGGTVMTVDSTKSYRYVPNIFKYKGYMRDEIYAFYIAFIMKDGSMSYAYHIPGRTHLGNEREGLGQLSGPTNGFLWPDIEDVSPDYGKRFHWADSVTPIISAGNYNPITYRGMNYWENATEFYPDTDNYEVWDSHQDEISGQLSGSSGSLSGKNVRHHHFPSNRNPNRKSIQTKHNCETTKSGGTTPPIQAWEGSIYKDYSINDSDINLSSSYKRTRWKKSGPNNTYIPDNDPDMYTALWNEDDHSFMADQPMRIQTRWEVWYTECGNAQTVRTRCRIKYANGQPGITINSDSIGHMGQLCCGTAQGGCQDANRAYSFSAWHNLLPGDKIYIEHKCDGGGGGCAHHEGHMNGVCNGSYPGSLNSSCTSNSVIYRMLTFLQIKVEPITPQVADDDLLDAKISHDVNILGFDLEDIKIPQSIANKIQGFKIYYAKRKHADRTILGQSIIIPGKKYQERLGICQEATSVSNASQVLNTLQDLPEPFYSMDPWARNFSQYESLPHNVIDTLHPNANVSEEDDHAYSLFSFWDFYLSRTKNSIAPATHIDLQYNVTNLVWNGPGLDQDKKMLTNLYVDSDPETPNTVKEIWGWDIPGEEQNCYPRKVKSGIFMGCIYNPFNIKTQPRLLGQKAKTYLLGDTIFKGEALGFGGKLFNEFGQSCIAFKLKDQHAISASLVESNPTDQNIGIFNLSSNPEFNIIGREHEGAASLVTTLNSQGSMAASSGSRKSNVAIVNLKAFKTDVYKSIDSQELVWTGFEVLGDDLLNFVFDSNGSMNGTGNTVDTEAGQNGIFGGDTFLCRQGVTTSLKPSNASQLSNPEKAVYYHIVESTDNINFRHIEDADSFYFPGTIAKTLLTDAGSKDFSHFDNFKYSDNYSEVNDIRPAFPLPIRDTVQDDFPTRTHRSAKHDPTSLIDNYRVFLANQYRDLPKNRGDLWKLSSFNNLLYFHMEESLFAAQGKQTMSMGDGSEAFVGSGDIFAQEPNELVQTEGGFGGTQSQYAALTTRYGYFFVDSASKKVFMMKDSLLEISAIGMEEWFRDNLSFELEQYGLVPGCVLDNPIIGFGFHSIYDPKFKRIILTKREFIPNKNTGLFVDGLNKTGLVAPCTDNPLGKVRFNNTKCYYEIWGPKKAAQGINTVCMWTEIPYRNTSYFTRKGWTISYYPELGIWGSFHDYVPYIYFNTSTDFYSLTDQYSRPVWIGGQHPSGPTTLAEHKGTTYGNAGIWKHNSNSAHGIYYQEWSPVHQNITYEEWLTLVIYYKFEIEFIHNEYKAEDVLTSAFNYTLETYNQEEISVLQHGFTSFFMYNTFQNSGENVLEYLVNTRRIGNNWKINKFRDMAAAAVDTSNYYMSTNTNVIGGINTGTVTTSSTNNMFVYDGMDKTINAAYLDLTKNWNLQRKFIDKWVGIRLIYDNISNNSLNLYSTEIAVRKMHR